MYKVLTFSDFKVRIAQKYQIRTDSQFYLPGGRV
jgi:hypothetical protein